MKKRLLSYTIVGILIISNIIQGILFYETKNENNELVRKFDDLLSTNFKPVVVTRSDTVGLGETYMANVYMASITENNLPTVVINDSIGEREFKIESLKDTLFFDDYYQTFIYENIPTEKGRHIWHGAIINNHYGRIDSLYFAIQYVVE